MGGWKIKHRTCQEKMFRNVIIYDANALYYTTIILLYISKCTTAIGLLPTATTYVFPT